jgi:hypothetical protein
VFLITTKLNLIRIQGYRWTDARHLELTQYVACPPVKVVVCNFNNVGLPSALYLCPLAFPHSVCLYYAPKHLCICSHSNPLQNAVIFRPCTTYDCPNPQKCQWLKTSALGHPFLWLLWILSKHQMSQCSVWQYLSILTKYSSQHSYSAFRNSKFESQLRCWLSWLVVSLPSTPFPIFNELIIWWDI